VKRTLHYTWRQRGGLKSAGRTPEMPSPPETVRLKPDTATDQFPGNAFQNLRSERAATRGAIDFQ
jgi:hypothetical protein